MNTDKTVIFDFDGTLVDTSHGIISAIRSVINRNGMVLINGKDYYQFIGPPLIKQLQEALGINQYDAERLNKDIIYEYKNNFISYYTVYDGVVDMIESLYRNNIELMLATFKPREQTQYLLRKMGVERLFSYLACGLENSSFSKATLVLDAINHASSERFRCLYIGDTTGDERAALDNGIYFIGVEYGFEPIGFSECTRTVSTIEELQSILLV